MTAREHRRQDRLAGASTMQADRRPGLLGLEEALKADDTHAVRDRVVERLSVEWRAIKAKLEKGMPPNEAQRARRLLSALYAAHQTVRAVWHYHHKSR